MKTVGNGKICSVPEPTATTLEARIQRLEDEREIREILMHYTRCVDCGDMAGIASCYTEDGSFYPSDKSGGIHGRKNIRAIFEKMLDSAVKTSMHAVFNQQIHFESDDEATVFAYFYANKSFSNLHQDEVTHGGYELRVKRESDGEWRMKDHKCFLIRQDGTQSGRFGENRTRLWPPVPGYHE